MAEEKKEQQTLDKPVLVKDILLMTIFSLEGKAWAYLGLTAHPETQKPEKDLNQARLAIDSIDAIYKILEPSLTDEEKKNIQVSLTNLRLNFVRE
uniref:DUF1844 domain-containing protein n=1 Tax=candidate division WOR-3 bacterium TaxID=2052148 RepID=A0A7V0Z4E5_UNCW3